MAKNPMFRVCSKVEREGQEKPFWPRLGVAFQNDPKAGQQRPSITVKLDSLPLTGELFLFPDDGRDKAEATPF